MVEHGVGHLQIFILVLGTPHHTGELVRTAQVVGAVLSEDEWAAMQDFCPAVHLMVEGGFGIRQPGPAQYIPAVVAVQADEIGKALALAGVGQAGHQDRISTGALLGVEAAGQLEQGLEVFLGARAGALRLVEQAPCDDRGVVFVPVDHIGQGCLVVLEQRRRGLLLKKALLPAVALIGGQEVGRALHKAHGGDFVNDKEALLIGHLVDLLGVGVVAGAEAVCADPLHQLKIPLDGRQIKPAAPDVGILVPTEAPQIDRAAVEQETSVPDLKGADADPVQILVHHRAALVDADDQIVEIGGVDIPQLGVFDHQRASGAGAFGHPGGAVVKLHSHGVGAVGGHGIVDLGPGLGQAVSCGIVQHPLLGQGHQPDGPVDAGVVVKIKVGCSDLSAIRKGTGGACGQHRLAELVIRQNTELVKLVVAHDVGHGGIKGQEAALVLGHLHAIDKDPGPVGDRAKPENDVPAAPFRRDKKAGLVPEITAVFAGGLVGEQVAEGGRHRHGKRGGQFERPSGLHTLALGIEAETPHPVQADETAGGGSAGIQQGAVHQDDLTFISPAAFCVPQGCLLSLYPV